MSLAKRDVKAGLLNKFGFVEVEGSSHEAVAFYYGGKKIATTRFSRSGRDISDSILTQMAKQTRVQTLSFFKGMITCSHSREDYLKRLKELGFL